MSITMNKLKAIGALALMLILLLAVLWATATAAGCAGTTQAIEEFRRTNEQANLAIAEIRTSLDLMAELQGDPSEVASALGDLLTLTEGVSQVVEAGAEAAQKIKDAEVEEWRQAFLVGGEAAVGSLIGPNLAAQLFGAGGILAAAGGAFRTRKEIKRRGQAEARAAAAEAKNGASS